MGPFFDRDWRGGQPLQHTDALGTPVAVTDANRNVIERSEYEPYGQLLNRPQHDGPGFTGHVQDALTGLTYMQQRYYDPMIGSFLSVDPVTALNGSVASFNRYRYGNDNPYKFTDPDGRISKKMKKMGYVDLGHGYVARVDRMNVGGKAVFEVHVYKAESGFDGAAESRNRAALLKAEVNTIKTDGTWGKHGKNGAIQSDEAFKNLENVVDSEMDRHNVVRNVDQRYIPKSSGLGKLIRLARLLGIASLTTELSTPSPDRGCNLLQGTEGSSDVCN